jgi:hypothetical protein
MELSGKFPENWPHFEELFFEIANIFCGFGQISSFFFFVLKSPYLANRF